MTTIWVGPMIVAYLLIALMSWCTLLKDDKRDKAHADLKAHYEKNMLLFQSALHRIRHLEEAQVKVVKFGSGESWEKLLLVYNEPTEAAGLGEPGQYHILEGKED